MTTDFLYKLKKEYSASGMPTLIADSEMHILWANSLGNFLMLESGSNASFIFGDTPPGSGLFSKNRDGEKMLFNSVKTCDPKSGEPFYIIELIGSEKLDSVLASAAMRDYVSYLCAKIRNALANISFTSDKLFEDVSVGIADSAAVTNALNSIQENIMTLAREFVQPEQLYMLCDTQKTDDIILLDKKMSQIAAAVKRRAGKSIRVSEDYDKGIYFHMNTEAFETMIAVMTAECCCMRLYPDRLIYSVKRVGENRAEISVMMVNIDGKANDICCPAAADADERGLNRNMFFGYMSDILAMRNGVRVTKQDTPNSRLYKMEMDVVPRDASVFSDKTGEYDMYGTELYEKIGFFLGDIRSETKYYYTDMQ